MDRRAGVSCPGCGRKTKRWMLERYGGCAYCSKQAPCPFRKRPSAPASDEDRLLTAEETQRSLDEFTRWLEGSGTAWDRAVGGLRMFVVGDDFLAWP